VSAGTGPIDRPRTRPPQVSDPRKRMLDDIAILGRAELITEELGSSFENTELIQLGRACKVSSDKDSTTIIAVWHSVKRCRVMSIALCGSSGWRRR
jgi:chaperonin GroEL (HSP60 family)